MKIYAVTPWSPCLESSDVVTTPGLIVLEEKEKKEGK